eukprot:3542837-Prorocentrum_lima.AAC.1
MPNITGRPGANQDLRLRTIGDPANVRQNRIEGLNVSWMQRVWETEEDQHPLSPELQTCLANRSEQL